MTTEGCGEAECDRRPNSKFNNQQEIRILGHGDLSEEGFETAQPEEISWCSRVPRWIAEPEQIFSAQLEMIRDRCLASCLKKMGLQVEGGRTTRSIQGELRRTSVSLSMDWLFYSLDKSVIRYFSLI